VLLDLMPAFSQALSKLNHGELQIAGVNDYGDKVVIVLTQGKPKPVVQVLDNTPKIESLPAPVGAKEIEGSKESNLLPSAEVPARDSEGRLIVDGNVLCKRCGKACTPRGITRHENKCTDSHVEPTARPKRVRRAS